MRIALEEWHAGLDGYEVDPSDEIKRRRGPIAGHDASLTARFGQRGRFDRDWYGRADHSDDRPAADRMQQEGSWPTQPEGTSPGRRPGAA
jgi:hypothetical protein